MSGRVYSLRRGLMRKAENLGRALLTGLIAGLICGCGGSQPNTDQAKPGPSESTPVGDEPSTVAGETEPSLPLSGAPRKNKHLQLEVYEAGFDPAAPAAPPGKRYFTVGIRGVGVSRGADVAVDMPRFMFAQNEHGCLSRPEASATWLKDPFDEVTVFTAKQATKGHLAFLVPDDTQQVRVLIAPAGGGGFAVSAGDEFEPSWPEPIQTIEDGSTLRVFVLPAPESPPAVARGQVVLDLVIENLTTEQGIEFTTSQQLRMVDQSGKFVQPSAATKQIGCRLDDGDVIPPGHSRRLMVAYDMPPGEPRRLNYRGFEVDEVTVDLP